jgi:hypothetical protein
MRKMMIGTGLMLSLFATGAFAESWTGVISDDACGAKHAAATAADQRCAASCIKSGGTAVFVAGDKVYKIDNPDSIKGHEGHKVTITGKMSGESVHIDSVKM